MIERAPTMMAEAQPRRPGAPPDPAHLLRRAARLALSLPLFYKVLIGNCAVVVLGAVAGTWLTVFSVQHWPWLTPAELVALFALVGTVLSLGVNIVVLKAAFSPLTVLERTAEEVRRGNLAARVPPVLFTDPRIERLRETMNAMLDALSTYRQQLQSLSSQVINAQEEERKRIARELHDQTAQALTTLLIHLRLIEAAQDLAEIRRRTRDLRELTARTIEDVRKLALELRPTTLDHLGLVPALEWYIREYQERFGLTVAFQVAGDPERLSPQAELVLYRVAQEALTNIAKHAQASQVQVGLSFEVDRVILTVVDNGQGFDVAAAMQARERGLGLFGMQERVGLVGGRLRIESQPGRGTRVVAEVPLAGWSLADGR